MIYYIESEVVGSWRTKFEDGSRIGIQSQVRDGLQNACTIPEINFVGDLGIGHDQVVGVV